MNVGRILIGLHRGASHAVHNMASNVSLRSAPTESVRTLMTSRFQSLLQPRPALLDIPQTAYRSPYITPTACALPTHPIRTKVQWSRTNGGPRSVRAVTHRFFRLHNGQWIRTQAGRMKHKWKKTPRRLARLEEHLMCNRTQSRLLDRMVERYFKEPKFYPNDPYAPYHKWDNLPHYRVLRHKPRFLP